MEAIRRSNVSRYSFLVVVLTMSLFSVPTFADDDDPNSPVEGQFARLDKDVLELQDKRRFELLSVNLKSIRESLRIVTSGQRIRLLRRDLKVHDIIILDTTFEVDATLDSPLRQQGRMWLQLKEGGEFRVADDKIKQIEETLYFCQKGSRLRLTIYNRYIVGAQVHQEKMGKARIPFKSKLRNVVESLQKGDVVLLNGKIRGSIDKFDAQSITVQALDEDGSNKGTPQWIPKGMIVKLKNFSAADRDNGKIDPLNPNKRKLDFFDKERVQVGDTIQVAVNKGVLVSLNQRQFILRVWRKGQFTERVTYERDKYAKKVRRRELSSDRRISTKDGEIRINCFRDRNASKARYHFRARISHNIRGFVLVDAGLQGYREGNPKLGAEGPYYRVEPIFAGEVFEWSKTVENIDPSTDLLLIARADRNLISVKSKRARDFIGLRLVKVEMGDDLLQGYQAVIENKDKRLVGVVLGHATQADLSVAIRDQATLTLAQCGLIAVDLMLQDLQSDDKDLFVYRIDARGQPIKKKRETDAFEYRKQVFGLLTKMNTGVDRDRAFKLFLLFKKYSDSQLGNLVLKVLQSHAKSAVDAVVEIASNIAVGASEKQIAEISLAAKLLRNLGKPAIEPLCKILESLEQDDQANAVRRQQKTLPPDQLIGQTLDFIINAKRRRLRRQYNRVISSTITKIETLQKFKSPKEAEKFWRGLLKNLETLPNNLPQLNRVLPRVYLEIGLALEKQRRRGEAGAFLEKCMAAAKLAKNRKIEAQSKKVYGKLLLLSANEEVGQVVLRKGPSDLYTMKRGCNRGDTFPLAEDVEATEEWIPVRSGGKVAWIRKSLVDFTESKPRRARVTSDTRTLEELRAIVKKGRAFNASLLDLANQAEAELLAREVLAASQTNDYTLALTRMQDLQKLNPNHAVLEKYTQTWLIVNWIYPVLALAFLFGFLGVFFRSLLNRKQTQVARPDEYVFYGPDRAKKEREL
ncbi:MAG: hypothetical protein P1V97_28820 [Planctomycetota bacterium]|nr:hypothetical protein [Planctomycetota bacterium]